MTNEEFERIRCRILMAKKRGTQLKKNNTIDLVEQYIYLWKKLKEFKKGILENC